MLKWQPELTGDPIGRYGLGCFYFVRLFRNFGGSTRLRLVTFRESKSRKM